MFLDEIARDSAFFQKLTNCQFGVLMAFPFLEDFIRHFTGFNIWLPIPFFGMMVAAALYTGVIVVKKEALRLYGLGRLNKVKIKNPDFQKRKGDAKNTPEFIEVTPDHVVPDLCFVTAISGMIGARIFHILEYPEQFMANPLGMIFSRGGFTIFGGLILGILAGVRFVRKAGLQFRVMLDAAAPALILGYGVGRIGCQISGDGDWGIAANMALKPEWLPTWLWASRFENNIVGEIIPAPGVYPTPLYETMMAVAIFALLWAVRKHPFKAGWLFSLYVLLAGVERFLIEKIRVNTHYEFFGISATQAEIISIVLMISGSIGLAFLSKREVQHAG
jgi:phosphatidylglycerol:prolipoprotein diacylglycerol transferase